MVEKRKPIEALDKISSSYKRERLFQTIKRQCSKRWRNFNQAMVDANVYEKLDYTAKYLISNPILLAVSVAIVAAVAIPLLLFVLFATVNVALAFASFIVIEVTVLTLGATVLCCMLLCVISTITITGVCIVFAYYITHYVLSLVKSVRIAGI